MKLCVIIILVVVMKIIINDTTYYLENCKRFKDRLLGNMFRKKIKNLLFEKCNSIHTFFMIKSIDVLFLDKDNKILKTISNLKPWKIVICKRAYKVIELPSHTIKGKIKILD